MSGNLAPLKQRNLHHDLNANVIDLAASMFVNLKLNKINNIN
jgi:hypothetical protein